MKHIGTKPLETKRLILRPFIEEDLDAIYHNWANDRDVTEYLCWQAHENLEVTKTVLHDIWLANYSEDDFYQWAIVPKDIGEPIGCIGVVKHQDDIQMVHIGYALGKKWWNQGITSEALSALITFFFEEVGVNRVESRHDTNNPNSGKVMKKCGMIFEGTLRQADTNNKGIVDACMYGILRADYENEYTKLLE